MAWAAFLVVAGIAGLILQVANQMYYAGMPGSLVVSTLGLATAIGDTAWLSWRLREFERRSGR